MASSFSQGLSSHLACWRQVVAPLPSPAQSALLIGDPLGDSFGSTQTVADALARSPQVAVVYWGAPPGRAGSERAHASSSRAAPPQYQGPSRFQRTSNRFLPYPSASRQAQSSSRDRRGPPGWDGSFSTRRASGQPFRTTTAASRGSWQ
ncbi:hypothetical protein E2C01_070255 [Portunus trituberculatus]|uniref:Uncharacterized protein n=1 Tax=Portunus trituberculatus TaxID=210409 RepID=A0A5B7I4L9_PORTR|nr:hypothetical protein [Portunus trituberculatus]